MIKLPTKLSNVVLIINVLEPITVKRKTIIPRKLFTKSRLLCLFSHLMNASIINVLLKLKLVQKIKSALELFRAAKKVRT